jgi:ATP-dependent DNA helicase PIF1
MTGSVVSGPIATINSCVIASPESTCPTGGPTSLGLYNKTRGQKTAGSSVALSEEQQGVVDPILAGKNVFLTGAAGSGKSVITRTVVDKLRARHKCVHVLAFTGLAALNVDGATIFSYAAWKPESPDRGVHELVKQIRDLSNPVRRRFQSTDVLIIDEISMVSAPMLDMLHAVISQARLKPETPARAFGGIQAIFVGDFFQLPPIQPFRRCYYCGSRMADERRGPDRIYTCPIGHDHPLPHHRYEWHDNDKWAFKSEVWKLANLHSVYLHQVYRQEDPAFVQILNEIRWGRPLSPGQVDLLMNDDPDIHNTAIRIMSTRRQVERINTTQTKRLPACPILYRCHDGTGLTRGPWTAYLRNLTLRYSSRDEKDAVLGDEDDYAVLRQPTSYWSHIGNEEYKDVDGQVQEMPLAKAGTLRALTAHRFLPEVTLKTDMLVMLLVNFEKGSGLCNGSQGVVCGWEKYGSATILPSLTGTHALRETAEVRAYIHALMLKAEVDKTSTVDSGNGNDPMN